MLTNLSDFDHPPGRGKKLSKRLRWWELSVQLKGRINQSVKSHWYYSTQLDATEVQRQRSAFVLIHVTPNCCCCCFLTLTDPLQIQPWSQDRRNQTKSNRESEITMESRQKRTDKEVASKGHRRDKIENINKNTQTVETN